MGLDFQFPTPKSNNTAPTTIGTLATPTSKPMLFSSKYLLTPHVDSSQKLNHQIKPLHVLFESYL